MGEHNHKSKVKIVYVLNIVISCILNELKHQIVHALCSRWTVPHIAVIN